MPLARKQNASLDTAIRMPAIAGAYHAAGVFARTRSSRSRPADRFSAGTSSDTNDWRTGVSGRP